MLPEQRVDAAPLFDLLAATVGSEVAELDKACPYLAESHLGCMMQARDEFIRPGEVP